MGTEKQVVRVQEIHRSRSRTTTDTRIRRRITTIATVQNHIGTHVFQGLETGLRHVIGLNTLDGLKRFQIEAVVIVVRHNQIGLVRPATELQVHLVHVALNVRGSGRRAAVRGRVEGDIPPERPRCCVDTTDRAGSRREVDQCL